MAEISTQRLIMRGWQESDLAPWATMNADPEVRRYLGPLLSFEQAAAWVLNFQDDLDRHGFGFWAVELRASGEFIGFTGLGTVDEEMPFTGFEIGWRLACPAWGHGYATEAARAALAYGFDILGLPEIIAVTMAANLRSQAVMRRIGMTSDPAEDFDDPDVDESPLRRHVVFRKRRPVRTLPSISSTCIPVGARHEPERQRPYPGIPPERDRNSRCHEISVGHSDKLNDRPRAILGFRRPCEVFAG